LIDWLVTADRRVYAIDISAEDGAARAWLHEAGAVEEETNAGAAVRLVVRLSDKAKGQFAKAFPAARFGELQEPERWRA
ncbi:MAG TPA: hypothetical protein VNH64_04975, partial [Parvularculaceae bacterium]|nr:hypothetical protein [Parvularculaceae bacterium]